MSIQAYIEKAFWALFLAVVTFGVSFLKELSANVSELNNKVSVILVRFDDHEVRIKMLESDRGRNK